MMKTILLLTFLVFSGHANLLAQHYYPEIVSYGGGNTPIHGIKIKTNLPYTNGSHMPAIFIKGYNYNTSEPIALSLVWYIYNGVFLHHAVSSAGAYTPEIKLANENNKVVIYINDRQYFQRFFVSAFAKKNEPAAWFSGWAIVDEALNGTNVVTPPYKNRLTGDIRLPGGIWNKNGNVGIGTSNTGTDKLAVNGKIRAKEVKVEGENWPDYVFKEEYSLPKLGEIERYIAQHGHLPGIPAAEEIQKSGIDLGQMNASLLKKIEELTLYLIEQDKKVNILQQEIVELKNPLK